MIYIYIVDSVYIILIIVIGIVIWIVIVIGIVTRYGNVYIPKPVKSLRAGTGIFLLLNAL